MNFFTITIKKALGRDGKPAKCFLYYAFHDFRRLRPLIGGIYPLKKNSVEQYFVHMDLRLQPLST